MNRFLAIALASVASSFAAASFDLVLIGDVNVNIATGTLGKVHRYDGTSGAYLGSFGAFTSAPKAIAAYLPQNLCYVTTTQGTFRFNYSTGEALSATTFSLSSLSLSADGTKLFGFVGSTMYALNSTTLVPFGTLALGYAPALMAMTASGVIVTFDKTNDKMRTYDSSTFALLNTYSQTLSTVTLGGACSLGGLEGVALTTSNGVSSTLNSIRITAAGAWTNTSITTFSNTLITDIGSCAPRHDGVYVLGTHPSVGERTYGYTNGSLLATMWARSQVVTAGPMATVLAPEPQSWAIFGVGIVALIAKRRKPVCTPK